MKAAEQIPTCWVLLIALAIFITAAKKPSILYELSVSLELFLVLKLIFDAEWSEQGKGIWDRK